MRRRGRRRKTLVNGDEDPEEEGLVSEVAAFGQLFVELRVGHGDFGGDVLVEDE